MYCIECGKQNIENAKYCSHCGEPQFENIEQSNGLDVEQSKNTSENVTIFNISIARKIIGWYLLWILFHLFLLVVLSNGAFKGYNSRDGLSDFWPLHWWQHRGFFSYYDITEFIAYIIFPIILFFIWKIFVAKPK